ncbi:MAG: glycosyltransferase family 4 protein [Nanoarchaeota archaeon]
MRVLMFGWEFPPFNSGGLGTACYGLTRGLNRHGVKVTFVLPRHHPDMNSEHVNLISADIEMISIKSLITGYMTTYEYEENLIRFGTNYDEVNMYGKNLFDEVYRYSRKAGLIAATQKHDVIHAHDWLTYLAGIEAKKISGKPLIIHVHATEFDRTGDHPNMHVYDIEKLGMEQADVIIAVSNYTKNKIVYHYGINPGKIHVVHNGTDIDNTPSQKSKLSSSDKVVLFLGRITLQKGPEYFLYAAKRCLEIDPNITFIFAGGGDMENFVIEKSAELGIASKVLFTGMLKGDEVQKAYQMADVYVMPSVSEPFGIAPLEAMKNKTPVIISKQSGVLEVIENCLVVDFWDIDDMANKILSVLRYSTLHKCLSDDGFTEVKKLTWDKPAKKCIDIYNSLMPEAS